MTAIGANVNFRIGDFVSVTDVPYQDLVTVSKAFAKTCLK